MAQSNIIPFAEWLPDMPSFANPVGAEMSILGITQGVMRRGATTATNVIPTKQSYRPVASLVASSNALSNYARGSFSARSASGDTYNFTGDQYKLYGMGASSTFSDYSKGGGYDGGTTEQWEFIYWGGASDLVIATNFNNPMQSLTLGGSAFADLAGSPPRARHCAIVRDFIVVGNVFDSVDGVVPNRVWWCAINNPINWTPSAITQCDYQTIVGIGGWVQKIIGGEFGLIFMDKAIVRMTYVGTPDIFRFDVIEHRGTPSPGSVVKIADTVFFLSYEGFMMIEGNNISAPIGQGKVDTYFFNDIDTAYYHRISVTVDEKNKLVLWAYPGAGNSGGNPNKILVYNYLDQKWSLISQEVERMGDFRAQGYTLEGLDAVSTSIDALTQSLDSFVWMGGGYSVSAFTNDHKLSTFSGTAMTAIIETNEQVHSANSRSYVSEVWPIIDGGTVLISVGTRNTLQDSVSWGAPNALDALGKANIRVDAKFLRYRTTISGGFNHAEGVLPIAAGSGMR